MIRIQDEHWEGGLSDDNARWWLSSVAMNHTCSLHPMNWIGIIDFFGNNDQVEIKLCCDGNEIIMNSIEVNKIQRKILLEGLNFKIVYDKVEEYLRRFTD